MICNENEQPSGKPQGISTKNNCKSAHPNGPEMRPDETESVRRTPEQGAPDRSVLGTSTERQIRATDAPNDVEAEQELDTMVELGYD